MISRAEILMGREVEYPLTAELEANLALLLVAINKLRAAYGKPMTVSSGYRPGRFNKAAGGAANSSHKTCQAVDFHDADGALKRWITAELLEQCGLWQEDPTKTISWLHVQTRPCRNRVFKP